jgi:hypothetical protein
MPTFNSITGQGTPPPTDSTMGEEVIQVTEDTPPQLEAPDPTDPWLGDGLDIPNTVSGGGGAGHVDPLLYTSPPDPSKPPPTPPPYEPAPGTNPVERAVIKALDFIHGQHGNIRDLAKWIDDRNPVAPGYFQGVMGVGETWGKDLIPIVGPDPNVPIRSKP